MSKHVEGVKGYFDTFNMFQHTYHLIWIKNQLNIKKVMSKNVMSPYSVF